MGSKDELFEDRMVKLLGDEVADTMCESLKAAFQRWHEFLVQKLEAGIIANLAAAASGQAADSQESEWIGVESLSRLRGLVGGRFQSIKRKWTEAGFPLRAHRGDRWKDFKVNDKGWVDLSNWILKQGFEARLAPESAEYIFEIRKLE